MLVIYFKDYDDTNIRVIKIYYFLSLENMPLSSRPEVCAEDDAGTNFCVRFRSSSAPY